MLYSLPNGKVIEISVEQYLEMDDEEFEFLLSINYGEPIEDPFFGSILEGKVTRFDPEDNFVPPVDKIVEDAVEPDIDYTPDEE
jgi:hypothetical protein